MSPLLDDGFIRSIKKRVEECSSIVQLRGIMNRYTPYLYTLAVREVFQERMEFFRENDPFDRLLQQQCEDFEEDLDIEASMALLGAEHLLNPQHGNNHPKLVRAVRANIDPDMILMECDEIDPAERAALYAAVQVSNGNKLEMCRILGITNMHLNRKINQYKLKPRINEVRKIFRENLSEKLRG